MEALLLAMAVYFIINGVVVLGQKLRIITFRSSGPSYISVGIYGVWTFFILYAFANWL